MTKYEYRIYLTFYASLRPSGIIIRLIHLLHPPTQSTRFFTVNKFEGKKERRKEGKKERREEGKKERRKEGFGRK